MRWPTPGRLSLLIYGAAASVFALGALHVALDADPIVTELAEASILWVFGAATGYVGLRLRRSGVTYSEARRILGFVVSGGILVGALATAYAGVRLWSGEPTTEVGFMASIGWSVGVAAGASTGFYYTRSQAALEEQQELTKRLKVLQRVLRHNLRNEMSVVGGASRDLESMVGGEDEAVAAKLDTIARHARAVMQLSEQSQALTRIWQGEGDATVDLGAVLEATVARFGEEHPDVPVETDFPKSAAIQAHARIGTAVEEAMNNAVEHNEAVEVAVRVREPDDSTLAVEVSDTGSGIPESQLRPLWTAGEAPLSHTTGLGLWLIYWLVETSDGDLDVQSDEGGTTVSMTFRRA